MTKQEGRGIIVGMAKNKAAVNKGATNQAAGGISGSSISPLDLARLTAHLAEAGLINRSGLDFNGTRLSEVDQRKMVVEAARFLDLCGEVAGAWSEAKTLEGKMSAQQKEIEALKNEHGEKGVVPLRHVLRVAGVSRISLTAAELKEIKVKGKWANLPQEKRDGLILLYLTKDVVQHNSRHPGEVLGVTPAKQRWTNMANNQDSAKLAALLINEDRGVSGPTVASKFDRMSWIKEGVPVLHCELLVIHLQEAKAEREHKQKRAAGKEARAKAQAERVKGSARNAVGNFERSKKSL